MLLLLLLLLTVGWLILWMIIFLEYIVQGRYRLQYIMEML